VVFKRFDSGKSGRINQSEMKRVLSTLGFAASEVCLMSDTIVACVRVSIRLGVKERGETRVRLCVLAFSA